MSEWCGILFPHMYTHTHTHAMEYDSSVRKEILHLQQRGRAPRALCWVRWARRACLRSVRSDSVWPHGPQHTRLLCPWDSPSRNTGEGCHFLLWGIFLTEGWSPPLSCLLHWQADSLPLPSPGKPKKSDGETQKLCALTCEILKNNKERMDVEPGSAISRGGGRREGAKCE